MQNDTRVKWWPQTAIWGAVTIALFGLWSPTPYRGAVVITSFTILILAVPAHLLWTFRYARLRPRARLTSATAAIGLVAIGFAVFRVQGVTGDFVPVLTWRWSEGPPPVEARLGLSEKPTTADYPQFLGPNRNAALPDVHLEDWDQHPPRVVWRKEMGAGWSAFSIVGTWAVTQEQRGRLECVVSYDLLTGEEQWVHTDEARYATTTAGVGPRATPTIDDGRVYAYGATGLLNCLDLSTGARIWGRNIVEENDLELIGWGNSCSPLLLDGKVIVSSGGTDSPSLLAYDAQAGTLIWQEGNSRAGYSSPVVASLAGRTQILIFNQGDLVAHDSQTGQQLWQTGWSVWAECVSQPVPFPEDRVFLSSGYGIGAKMYRVTRQNDAFSAAVEWESPRLKAKFTNVVVHEGSIYGLDNGVLVCLDPATGERRWKRGRYGHGQIMLIGDHLLIQAEDGYLAVVAARPDQFKELDRMDALRGKTWNNPAFAPPYLIVRNAREAICYELAIKRSDPS